MVSLASTGAGDCVQRMVSLRQLIDPRLVPADGRGPAGLETSLGSQEHSYKKKPCDWCQGDRIQAGAAFVLVQEGNFIRNMDEIPALS